MNPSPQHPEPIPAGDWRGSVAIPPGEWPQGMNWTLMRCCTCQRTSAFPADPEQQPDSMAALTPEQFYAITARMNQATAWIEEHGACGEPEMDVANVVMLP